MYLCKTSVDHEVVYVFTETCILVRVFLFVKRNAYRAVSSADS